MQNILTQKLYEIIEPSVQSLGFEIVQILFKSTGKATGSTPILEILIESRQNLPISIGDCQLVSKNIGVLLDVEEVINDPYNLEVSSAGLERPLVKLKDYTRFVDYAVKIKLKQSLDGRSNYNGKIIKVENEDIYLECDGKITAFNFDLIKTARLQITDEIFKKLLKESENRNNQ